MKRWFVIVACALALLIPLDRSVAAPTSVRDDQIKLVRGYVAALQSKDAASVMKFFHPAVRACVNDKTRSFFEYIVSQQLQGFPSGNYSRLSITPVAPKKSPSLWLFVPAKEFPYPVMPTYNIQIDFDSTPDGLYSDMLEAAPSGTSWYLVTACPNADGMRFMRAMQAEGARQKARAKKLAAAVNEPFLSQIKRLLANHDRFGAIKAYQKATGADMTTAVLVIDEIENPNH